ncbi:MAG: HdeD family acid-resistance protein [Vulcanimicrobiaceae bacterium]
MKEFAENIAGPVEAAHEAAHKEWGWYLALGIALILVGVFAIWSGTAATLASIIVLGAVLMVAGVAQIISAFMARGAGHVILLLLVGALDAIVGLMLVQHPGMGALAVTLLLAALFVFGGTFRFVSALWLQFPHYGWVAFSSLITLLLGLLLWAQWPISASWFIGFAVGVNFIFSGCAWSTMAWRLKDT